MKKVFRKLSVVNPFISIMFYINDNDDSLFNYNSLNALLRRYPKNVLLKNALKEEYSYEFLTQQYREYTLSKKSDLFVEPIRITSKCYIDVDDENIVIYSLRSKKLKFRGKRLFDWEYPSAIVPLGKCMGQSLKQVCKDYKTLSTIEFLGRYVLPLTNSKIYEKPIQSEIYAEQIMKWDSEVFKFVRFYRISESIGISVDEYHVYLFPICNGNIDFENCCFVSDTWSYTDEEILRDLFTLSIMKYGQEYVAYWVSPLELR